MKSARGQRIFFVLACITIVSSVTRYYIARPLGLPLACSVVITARLMIILSCHTINHVTLLSYHLSFCFCLLYKTAQCTVASFLFECLLVSDSSFKLPVCLCRVRVANVMHLISLRHDGVIKSIKGFLFFVCFYFVLRVRFSR